jgi:hypothetical protein
MRTSAGQSPSPVVMRASASSVSVRREEIEQLLPGPARARQIAERALDQAGELAEVLGLLGGVCHDPLDLEVEDLGQLREAAVRRVDLGQDVERLAVVGIEANHFLEPLRGPRRILERAAHDVGDAPEDRLFSSGLAACAAYWSST